MSQLATRATLLVRVRDARDCDAWAEFVDLYMPLIYSYALKNGLQEADAADVAQETLFSSFARFPPFNTNLRRVLSEDGYLLSSATNFVDV